MDEATEAWSELEQVPAAPKLPRPRRHRRGGTPQTAARGLGDGGGEERSALEQRVRRLEQEIQDLREAYARKIAHTELKCDKMLREKEDSNKAWYKARRTEIAQMSSAVTIMQALFRRRTAKHEAQMLADKEYFEREQELLRQDKERVKAEHDRVLEHCTRSVQEKTASFEKRLLEAAAEKAALEESKRKLEDALQECKKANAKLQDTNEAFRRDNEELRRRVVDLERSEELAKRAAQIEALEAELKRTKKAMQEKRHAETEALRKELMDYVKFIVRVLPDDWQSRAARLGEDSVPAQLRARLASAATTAPPPPVAGAVPGPPGPPGALPASPPGSREAANRPYPFMGGAQPSKALPSVGGGGSGAATARSWHPRDLGWSGRDRLVA